jgi:hypothetical protein
MTEGLNGRPQKASMGGESITEKTIEAQLLIECDLGDRIDEVIGEVDGQTITVGNFLRLYGDSPHRKITEDIIRGFLAMNRSDDDYAEMRELMIESLQLRLGPPPPTGEQ